MLQQMRLRTCFSLLFRCCMPCCVRTYDISLYSAPCAHPVQLNRLLKSFPTVHKESRVSLLKRARLWTHHHARYSNCHGPTRNGEQNVRHRQRSPIQRPPSARAVRIAIFSDRYQTPIVLLERRGYDDRIRSGAEGCAHRNPSPELVRGPYERYDPDYEYDDCRCWTQLFDL